MTDDIRAACHLNAVTHALHLQLSDSVLLNRLHIGHTGKLFYILSIV